MTSPAHEIKEILAMRNLTLKRNDGRVFECKIILGNIQESPDGLSFFCPTQIVGYGRENVMDIHGTDSYQALTLAIEYMHITLSSYAENGSFTWMDLEPQILPRDLWTQHIK